MNKPNEKNVVLLALCALLVPLAMAPKGPSSAEVKKYSSQTLKVGSKGPANCAWPMCGGFVIEELDATDNLVRELVYGGGTALWQILSDGSSQYYHEDPRGNVVMLTEGAGSPTETAGDVLERVTYDAYGKPLFQDAANQNKTNRSGILLARSEFGNTLLHSGRWYDPETGNRGATLNADFGGLYVFDGRYLNPDEGRFISRATSGCDQFPQESGRYGFAGQAPVNGTGGPIPQTREHILLGRQVGVPRAAASGRASGKRQHKPFMVSKPTEAAASKKLFVGGLAWQTEPEPAGDESGRFWFEGLRPGAAEDQHGPFWFEGLKPGAATTGEDGEFWFEDLDPGVATTGEDGEFWFEGLVPGAAGDENGEFWFESLTPGAGGQSQASQDCCNVSCSCPPSSCCNVSCSCPPSGGGGGGGSFDSFFDVE